jgi:hypothetical protein
VNGEYKHIGFNLINWLLSLSHYIGKETTMIDAKTSCQFITEQPEANSEQSCYSANQGSHRGATAEGDDITTLVRFLKQKDTPTTYLLALSFFSITFNFFFSKCQELRHFRRTETLLQLSVMRYREDYNIQTS